MKILIIGIVASGKTTLAKRLANENNINYYELDSIVHDDKLNKKRTNEEQQKIIKDINKQNSWIIEGTLRKNLYNLLELSEKIIYLDISLSIRKRRILTRYIKQLLKIEHCNYKLSPKILINMYKWTYSFEKNKKNFEKDIFSTKKSIIILNTVNQINEFKI